MFLFICLFLAFVATACTAGRACKPFPPSMLEFSAQFEQPKPPLVNPEFKTNFIQHKWNENVSHITAGFIYNSPSQGLVRVDHAYEGGLASSSFNYSNVTDAGLVDNTVTTFLGSSEKTEVWRGYVNSNFPLFLESILVESGAIFTGLAKRDLVTEWTASWSIMYQGVIPVTVYVNGCNNVVGYDYFTPSERTRVVTEFFSTTAGAVRI
ncbi:uncharacterized protein BDR25DRAFT_375597 [Lindgomyces ingoldianus]|uniref:Uncharacterized protein n=1 Tax=Lindgomyces ingoldianus TaxID=673940 RepID=A0ACB6RE53_9PLEO|nr:uncharacterized protein BDR25DRAFT_375597 [Lindgomyces ingoldianus]KAF2476600.1 hypothetical protein BDR25DRAFT_375597 [Lindgomyces ingoldianus]